MVSSRSMCLRVADVVVVLAGLLSLLWYHQLASANHGSLRRLETPIGSQKSVDESVIKIVPSKKPLNLPSMNRIHVVHVVGVEGSGQNEVGSVIATIGKTCNQHVILKSPSLRTSRIYKRDDPFQSFINLTKLGKYTSKEVMILDEQSFPSEGLLRNSTSEEKRKQGRYSIDWLHNQVVNDPNVTLKIVYVHRDPYQAAASVATDNQPFRSRIDAAVEFAAYLTEEHALVSSEQADVWTQVAYESFAAMDNCTALVAGVADFMQWRVCDVDFACQVLRETFRPQADKELVGDHVLYVQDTHANLHIPSIPELDISETKIHSFETFVSSRKSFSFTNAPLKRATLSKRKREIPPPPPAPDRLLNFTGVVRNKVSYVYIVGVEGVGHHGVTPAIAAIAKTCNYHVLYESATLRRSWYKNLPNGYKSSLEAYKRQRIKDSNKIVIIEDQSFPTGAVSRVSSPQEKKNLSMYNLEWIYTNNEAVGVDTKFLHLTRDFYRAVASHPEFDRGFEPHARVLHEYLQHIKNEYDLIDRRAPGRWRELQYESFTQMHNCTALVSAVVEFMQWDQCDVDFACEVIRSTVRSSSKNRTVDAANFAYAAKLNATTSIPRLDLTPHETYNFTTVVSARKMFSFITNMTTRARGNFPSAFAFFNPRSRNSSSVGGGGKYLLGSVRESNNNVSFLYVVGIDGAGNGQVSSALKVVAESCNYQVIFKSKSLWRAQTKTLPRTYYNTLGAIAHSVYKHTNKVLIMEDTPIAQGEHRLNTTSDSKRKQGKNNLGWVHARLGEFGGVAARYLYVHRPVVEVVDTVLSVTESLNALSVQKQGELVREYAGFVREEYEKIARLDNSTWAQAEYAWFARGVSGGDHASGALNVNCSALVDGIVAFTGWSGCDAADACAKLTALKFPDASLDASKYSLLDGVDTVLPIPFITYQV